MAHGTRRDGSNDKNGGRGATRLEGRDPQLLRRIYEVMVLTRAVEDRMVAMYRGGDLLGSLYTGHWHEAISVGCGVVPAPRRLHGAASTATSARTCGAAWSPGR